MTQSIYPALRYDDGQAAVDFLREAFGFQEVSMMKDEDGSVGHAELALDGAVVMVSSKNGNVWSFGTYRPADVQ